MHYFRGRQLITCSGLAVLFLLAAVRVHMRVHTTLVGYELGRLKNHEAELLEERSLLKMELAKLTTKSQLTNLANSDARASHFRNLAAK